MNTDTITLNQPNRTNLVIKPQQKGLKDNLSLIKGKFVASGTLSGILRIYPSKELGQQFVLDYRGGDNIKGITPLLLDVPKDKKESLSLYEGRTIWVRVYPNLYHARDKSGHKCRFFVFASALNNIWGDPKGIFYIQGIWHRIPQCSNYTVITAYRNYEMIKKENPFYSQKQQKGRHRHIPVIMNRNDCYPLWIDNNGQGERQKFFISGQFRFFEKIGVWGWQKDSFCPTIEIPLY